MSEKSEMGKSSNSKTTRTAHSSQSQYVGAGAGGGENSKTTTATATSTSTLNTTSKSSSSATAKSEPAPTPDGQAQTQSTKTLPGTSASSNLNSAVSNVMLMTTALECRICLDPCASPIYGCVNGHLLCTFCRDKLSFKGVPTCPLMCTGPLTPCPFAERLSAQHDVTLDCRFKESGCSEPIKATLFKNHLQRCQTRDVECSKILCFNYDAQVCKKGIAMWKFPQHAMDVHKRVIFPNEMCSKLSIKPLVEGNKESMKHWEGQGASSSSKLIGFDGHTFLLHVLIQSYSLHWWFTVLSNAKTAEKYYVDTRILDFESLDKPYCNNAVFRLPVLPYHENPTFNKFVGSYATVSGATLTKIYTHNSQKDPEKNSLAIFWYFCHLSQSKADRLRDRKLEIENELVQIQQDLEEDELAKIDQELPALEGQAENSQQ